MDILLTNEYTGNNVAQNNLNKNLSSSFAHNNNVYQKRIDNIPSEFYWQLQSPPRQAE